MDRNFTGEMIKSLRIQKGITQQELAERLSVTPQAISKWECGNGMPDHALLAPLADALSTNVDALLSAKPIASTKSSGNLNNLCVFYCPVCENVTLSADVPTVSCCGRNSTKYTPVKANDEEKLSVEIVEDELFITSTHSMTREDYISFVALVANDTVVFKKLYPEWDLQVRLPRVRRGRLLWFSAAEGLKYQLI